MENDLLTQFDKWNIKVPDYVEVRINNGKKPLIDFCNDVVKKFEELSRDPLAEKINALVERLEAEYLRDVIFGPRRKPEW